MTELIIKNLTRSVEDTQLFQGASFSLRQGEFIGLLGPNGAGKTSLIRSCLGFEPTSEGEALLDGEQTTRISPMDRARRIAYLPQTRPLAWPICVHDVVALGRFSHGVAIGKLSAEDSEAVTRALEACDLMHLKNRNADTLSGGELARMHCARAFAAEAPLLIADEPTAALDPRHQFRILDLVAEYVSRGGGAMVVLHDIQMAARFASRLIWMKGGRILADGTPKDTLTEQRLAEIYGIRAEVNGLDVNLMGPL